MPSEKLRRSEEAKGMGKDPSPTLYDDIHSRSLTYTSASIRFIVIVAAVDNWGVTLAMVLLREAAKRKRH